MSFCPHCHSGVDPVLKDTTWSCGVRFNDALWRTKECYKRQIYVGDEHLRLQEQHISELEEENGRLKQRIKRLEEAVQERDKEWFQVIESILGFHPVSMTEALRIGIERIKKQRQRIKRLEEAGDELIWAFCPASVSMMTERESGALKLWTKAKEAKL